MSKQKSSSIFSSFAENIGKYLDISKLSCANQKAPSESNKENIASELLKKNSNLCGIHMREKTHFCKECSQTFCFICASDHLSKSHEILELKEIPRIMGTTIQNLTNFIDSSYEGMYDLSLPDFKSEIEEGMNQLQRNKELLCGLIIEYYQGLAEEFQKQFEQIPSVYKLDKLRKILAVIREDLLKFNTTANKNNLTNYQSFLSNKFEAQIKNVLTEYENLKNFSMQNKRINIPQIISNPAELYKLKFTLSNLDNVIPPAENSYDQIRKIRISTPNYFLPEFGAVIPFVDDLTEKLHLYHVEKETSESFNLNITSEIPAEHTLIVTPKLDIYLTGGILKNGVLTNSTFLCNPIQELENSQGESGVVGLQLKPKANMINRKVAHALVYVKNIIYSIGGKIGNNTRTNQCEKYDINNNKWYNIAQLNHERTRAGVTAFDDKFIYAFWGTENDNNTKTIEKYSIETDRWDIVKLNNSPGIFEVTFISSIQINHNQILLMGGFTDGKQTVFNKNAALFNVKEENLVNLGEIIPIPLCQSYQPLVQNNSIYSSGYIFKNTHPIMNRFMEGDYIWKIENGNLICKDIFYYK